jgi:hypothetical protein
MNSDCFSQKSILPAHVLKCLQIFVRYTYCNDTLLHLDVYC